MLALPLILSILMGSNRASLAQDGIDSLFSGMPLRDYPLAIAPRGAFSTSPVPAWLELFADGDEIMNRFLRDCTSDFYLRDFWSVACVAFWAEGVPDREVVRCSFHLNDAGAERSSEAVEVDPRTGTSYREAIVKKKESGSIEVSARSQPMLLTPRACAEPVRRVW